MKTTQHRKKTRTPLFPNLQERIQQTIRLHKPLLLIILLSLGVRLWHITWGLPSIYEEATPFMVSWKFWNWGGPGLDFNPHFFNYPALTFYLHFIGQVIHYVVGHILGSYSNLGVFQSEYNADPTVFIVIARLLTVFFDVGITALTYILTNRLTDRRTALLSALFVSINILHVKQSQLINVDTSLTFFVLLSALCIYRIYSTPVLKWYMLSGLSIGLAAGTKYNGAGLLALLAIVHVTKSAPYYKNLHLANFKYLIISFFTALAAFLIVNPYILFDFGEFLRDFTFEEHHVSYGHLGITPAESAYVFYLLRVLPANLGIAFSIVTALSFLYLLIRKATLSRYLIILLLPALYIMVIGRWEMRTERYILPAIPFLIIIGSVGIAAFTGRVMEYVKRIKPDAAGHRELFTPFLTASAAILLAIEPIMHLYMYQTVLGLPDTRTVAKEWITQHVPRGSIIVTGPYGIDFPIQSYKTFPLPFLAVQTEKNAPFYNTLWYEDCDLLVTSDLDYSRYIQEPERYKDFLPFYDSLSLQWKMLFEAKSGEQRNGPTIRLYAPPAEKHGVLDDDLLQQLLAIDDTARVNMFLQNFINLCIVRGKFEKVEQTLRAILSLQPNDPQTRKALGRFLIERRQYRQAIIELHSYLQKRPKDAEATALMGTALYNLNNLGEAEQFLRQALAMDNRMEFVYDYLLSIYATFQDRQHTAEILTRYLEILPTGSKKAQWVIDHLRELERMR